MKQHLNKERGAAHLILVLAFVVGLVGVLGFLGYNAWQKQSADAGGKEDLGRTEVVARMISGKAGYMCSITTPNTPVPTGKEVNFNTKLKIPVNPKYKDYSISRDLKMSDGRWVQYQTFGGFIGDEGTTRSRTVSTTIPGYDTTYKKRITYVKIAISGDGRTICHKTFKVKPFVGPIPQ